MKLPEFGVKKPVSTIMLFSAIVLLGLVAKYKLSTDLFPKLEYPNITVITVYPGATANEVEDQVTDILETTLSSTEHLKEIKSTSKENVSFIQLSFDWGSNIEAAVNDVRDKIEFAKSRLPDDASQPIIYKVNASSLPVILYGITGGENFSDLEKILSDDVAPILRKVEGVGAVIYLGQPEREIRVVINPDKMRAYKLSATQISAVLKANNINIPAGDVTIGTYDFSVRVPGKYENVDEIGKTVIKSINGQLVRLNDVATIKDTYKKQQAFARDSYGSGAALVAQKQSGANDVDVVKAIRKKMAEIKKTLPSDVKVVEIVSSDEFVTAAINNLSSSIWEALIFVTLVVLLFLREWKSSLIIFITMPISLITAFIFMYAFGYTINLFSLTSLIISIGMVVDNAIVILENITQHLEKGEMPQQASIFGASEMGTAIMASTMTTLIVFIPIIFAGGVVSILFKQLAVLTIVCMIMSLIVSLTLTPSMASRLLQPARITHSKRHSKLYYGSEKIFSSIENRYKIMLHWNVSHKKITLIAALATFLIVIYLGSHIGQDFIPDFDVGTITVVFETEKGTSARKTDEIMNKIIKTMVDNIPEIANDAIGGVCGQTSDGGLTAVGFKEGSNIGSIYCHLIPLKDRKRSSREIADALQPLIEAMPEVEKVNISGGSAIEAAGMGNKKPIEIRASGNDLDKLNAIALEFEKKLKEVKNFKNVETNADIGRLGVKIVVDKDMASRVGLNVALIGKQVRDNIYGAESSEYSDEKGDDHTILVQYDPEYRNDLSRLKDMQLTTLLGKEVPLSAVAEIVQETTPIEIHRSEQQRYVETVAQIEDISLSKGLEIAQKIIDETSIPEGISVELTGQVTEQETSFASLKLIFILGIIFVYMIMASQFESFRDPFIILFAIPLTLIGVILAFLITNTTLSLVTFIALIMLVGIVVNNGIVLVDYTNMLRKRGYGLQEAVMEAGRSRLRPVMMTSITTILGMLPLALSSGMGHELYSPLGITIIGGLLIALITTLIVVPTAYAALYNYKEKKEKK